MIYPVVRPCHLFPPFVPSDHNNDSDYYDDDNNNFGDVILFLKSVIAQSMTK